MMGIMQLEINKLVKRRGTDVQDANWMALFKVWVYVFY